MSKKCDICQDKRIYYLFSKDKYEYFICNNCKVTFIAPKPNYPHVYINNLSKYNSLKTEKAYFLKKDVLTTRAINSVTILSQYKTTGHLLDIGCSYGFYLKIFKEFGYITEGIDISKKAVNYALKKYNLRVYKKDFRTFRFSKKRYDIITLFDILEHLPNPRKTLSKINKLLKKNGIIIIQTPNIRSIIAKITGVNWFWLVTPQHIFLYSIKSLIILLESEKFKILHISTWDDYDEFIKNILWLFKLKDKGITKYFYFIVYYLFKLFYPLSIIWNKLFLGGEILIYAQKAY